jgi:hypothetical protein
VKGPDDVIHPGAVISNSEVGAGSFSVEPFTVQFDKMIDRLRDLAGLKIDGDPVQAVDRLAKATSLQEGEQAAVMRHLIEGGDLTAYGFWNAVTRTAEDVESYDRSTEIERVGGKLAAWSEREWLALVAA